jgi:FlaA1/EpsC-like NDP-sugar epimerase
MAASKRVGPRVRFRHLAVMCLDASAAVLALHIALWLRVGFDPPQHMIVGAWFAAPVVVVFAVIAHVALGMRRRLWRYASISDLLLTAQMAGIVAVGSALTLYLAGSGSWMPRSLPAIHWLVLVLAFGAMRVSRRLVSEFMQGSFLPPRALSSTAEPAETVLYLGRCDNVELLIRANQRRPMGPVRPMGILTDIATMPGMTVRGVPVLGVLADLERVLENAEAKGRKPDRVIFAETAERLREAPFLQLVAKAEAMGLKLTCLSTLEGGFSATQAEAALRSIDLCELLDRPQTVMDSKAVRQRIKGRRVLVSGAGGTIGRELVRQIASFEPSELVLLDASEFGLYDVDLEIKDKFPGLQRVAVLCSIRQRAQVMKVFDQYRPEIVYHAAALKHVPLVEGHPSAGVQTNVLGTRNVADAARQFGAEILVQVSTDKAVNPIGMMGATKRLGELYCQALDIADASRATGARFLTVRFGNVLGSSGSLIPLFQRQLDAGQPLTVTHPEIERFFMTVQEAVQLVLQASARTLNVARGRIFVLDMGQPIKVLDIARRMIRLAGKTPDDVGIVFVGLRPGEKLYEELFNDSERQLPSVLDGILEADPAPLPLPMLNEAFDELQELSTRGDDEAIRKLVFKLLAREKMAREPHTAANAASVRTSPALPLRGSSLKPVTRQDRLHDSVAGIQRTAV